MDVGAASELLMKILIVQTGFLGDLVLSTGFFAETRRMYPAADIAVMTTPEARILAENHPAVNRAIVFDKRGAHSGVKGFMEMTRRLQAEQFDLAFSLHKSFRTALLLRAARIPLRYGFRESALPWLYTATVRRSHLAHEALRNLVLLEAVGGKIRKMDSRLTLGIPREAEESAERLLGSHSAPIVGLAPGSVWATKKWTPSGFAAVGDELTEMGYRLVLLGGPKDVDSGSAVEALLERPVLNLIGKTDLITSAAVIGRLSLLITNDSAPLHIASALGVPVVAPFCATIPEFGFGPWKVRGETVGVSGLSCRPCGRHGGNSCPTGTHACQLKLRPDMVMDAVQRVLGARTVSDEALAEAV